MALKDGDEFFFGVQTVTHKLEFPVCLLFEELCTGFQFNVFSMTADQIPLERASPQLCALPKNNVVPLMQLTSKIDLGLQ